MRRRKKPGAIFRTGLSPCSATAPAIRPLAYPPRSRCGMLHGAVGGAAPADSRTARYGVSNNALSSDGDQPGQPSDGWFCLDKRSTSARGIGGNGRAARSTACQTTACVTLPHSVPRRATCISIAALYRCGACVATSVDQFNADRDDASGAISRARSICCGSGIRWTTRTKASQHCSMGGGVRAPSLVPAWPGAAWTAALNACRPAPAP